MFWNGCLGPGDENGVAAVSAGAKVTVAKYILPSGYDITKQGGLVPDNMCQGHPTTVPTFGSGEDPCLEEAVKHITAHSTRGAV